MSMVAGILVLVLLVLGIPVLSSAKLVVENSSGIGLPEPEQPSTVAIDMMHVHHVDSPYRQPNLTLLQRAQISAKRSKQRLSYFSNKVSGRRGMSEVYSSPVFSDHGQGDYVMQISVGTPPRAFSAFLDTGGELTWLQCTPCTTCYSQPDPMYDPTTSSTYAPINCNAPLCQDLPVIGKIPSCSTTGNDTCLYEYRYGDGSSTKGSLAYETFTFTNPNGSQMAVPSIGFGCATDQEPGFNQTQARQAFDGLVGIGGGPLSLLSQLGSNIMPVFSYCLVKYASSMNTTSPLLFGSSGTIVLSYTPLINNSFYPTFYYINLVGITINGTAVNYPADTFAIDNTTGSGGFIIDAAAAMTQLFDAAYDPFQHAISALVSYPVVTVPNFDLCYNTSSVSTPVFPTVVFQLQGVNLTLPSENVFMEVDTRGTYCMFISKGGLVAAAGSSLFGTVQQQNFQIAYDIAAAQVGFAATNCS